MYALFLNWDYGTDMEIMVDGKIYFGKSGFTDEIEYVHMFDKEIICGCGKKRCPEIVATRWVLLRNFRKPMLAGSYFKLPMRSPVNKLILSMVNNDTRIQLSTTGVTAGVIVESLMVCDSLLNDHAS
jgi:hypothetical protein